MDIKELICRQRQYFNSNVTHSISFRIQQLEKLRELLKFNESGMLDAIYTDLKKSPYNTISTELSLIIGEINHSLKHLSSWARKKRARHNMLNFPGRSYILPEPYGVTYIAGAWNYPYQLTLLPLVSAIAAGNTAVLKPSELSPCTSAVMTDLINNNFPREYIHVVEGGADIAEEILKQRFDKIFFTGGAAIGKIVYQAAAENLTPVTLELGGINPVIVLPDCSIKITAKRIVWGKFSNAGQTCIAPDYLLVHSAVKDELLKEMKRLLDVHFSQAAIEENYMAIVNDRHFERIKRLINPQKIYYGGVLNKEERFISPTILHNVSFDDDVMKEEIFGPLLPVIEFDELNTVLEKMKEGEKPLSFYVFGKKSLRTDELFNKFSFGGGSLNDTVMYFSNRNLPLGGVGYSGIGRYHGQHGFNEFSHFKSIMEKGTWLELWPFKVPPFSQWKLKILRWLIEK
jgi:aldehyde dehydrogenase (NAD+)